MANVFRRLFLIASLLMAVAHPVAAADPFVDPVNDPADPVV